MATVGVRWAVTEAVVGLLESHPLLQGVVISPGWPGDKGVKAEMVWAGDVSGDLVIPVGSGGRKYRDDKFTVLWFMRVTRQTTVAACKARVAEMLSAVEDVFADDPTIGDLDGVVSAEITGIQDEAQSTPEGVVGYATFTLSVHSRLS